MAQVHRTSRFWVADGEPMIFFTTRQDAMDFVAACLAERTALLRSALAEGWDRYHSGACYCGSENVSYPWHEEHIPGDGTHRCIRCGEHRPQLSDFTPTAAYAAAREQARVRNAAVVTG